MKNYSLAMVKTITCFFATSLTGICSYSQNVGIGTLTPQLKLDVRGLNADDGILISVGNSDLSHKLQLFGGRENDPNPFILVKAMDPLRFATDQNGFMELMRINPDGNVGVNITSPASKLHVKGDDVILTLEENSANDVGTGSQISFIGRTGSLEEKKAIIGVVPSDNAFFHRNGSLEIRVPDRLNIFRNDNVTNTSNLGVTMIGSSGNVGIGVVDPLEKLHVNGNIRVTDDANIFGLDQIAGFNDLKISGDANGGPDLSISAAGRVGINTIPSENSLLWLHSKPDDLYGLYYEDENSVFRLGVLKGGSMGINQIFSNVAFNVRGKTGDAAILTVGNINNSLLFNVSSNGNVSVTNTLSKGGGSFKIDHPLDPANKYLYHSFVESPDMMNVYNGNITTNGSGEAVVEMPDWFEALNRDFRYQLTVMGQFAQAIVAQKLAYNRFTIKTDKPNVEVSWQITGIRHDAFANKNRIPVEEIKKGAEKGRYLHAGSFGLPQSMNISSIGEEMVEPQRK